MRAATLVGPGEVTVTGDWPEPTAGPGDVIVAVAGVGVCGSDLAVLDGHRAVPRLPWVLGHEAVGDIVAVGAAVADRSVGQRVVIEPNYACLTCAHCRGGRTALCRYRRIPGINEHGLLAERVAVPAAFAWPVDGGRALEDLVCVEPLAVALSAVARAGVRPGERCLVFGAGSQGLLVCLALLHLGAVPSVVEPQAGRRATAGELGIAPSPADELFPVVFETSGVPDALAQAVERAEPDGRVVLIGQSDRPARLSTFTVVQRRLTLLGCLIYDHPAGFTATTGALTAIRPGRVLRGRFAFDEAPRAFREARDLPGKPWITFAEESGR
jgi:threonine dehydrogenase-like Zn-dependent dehydrogenase